MLPRSIQRVNEANAIKSCYRYNPRLAEYQDFHLTVEIELEKSLQRLGLIHSDICCAGLEFIGSCKCCDLRYGGLANVYVEKLGAL